MFRDESRTLLDGLFSEDTLREKESIINGICLATKFDAIGEKKIRCDYKDCSFVSTTSENLNGMIHLDLGSEITSLENMLSQYCSGERQT
jgi:hypothetical protein